MRSRNYQILALKYKLAEQCREKANTNLLYPNRHRKEATGPEL